MRELLDHWLEDKSLQGCIVLLLLHVHLVGVHVEHLVDCIGLAHLWIARLLIHGSHLSLTHQVILLAHTLLPVVGLVHLETLKLLLHARGKPRLLLDKSVHLLGHVLSGWLLRRAEVAIHLTD